MPLNIRNLIIFVVIGLALSAGYYFFLRNPEPAGNLVPVSTLQSGGSSVATTANSAEQNALAQNFLTLLLNVKNIKIDTNIFSDKSFETLNDSSIVITPDTNPGRPNPFAQFGNDTVENIDGNSLPTPTPVIPNATTPSL